MEQGSEDLTRRLLSGSMLYLDLYDYNDDKAKHLHELPLTLRHLSLRGCANVSLSPTARVPTGLQSLCINNFGAPNGTSCEAIALICEASSESMDTLVLINVQPMDTIRRV